LLAYEDVKNVNGDIGNLRVSSSAVELDLLLDSEDHLKEATEALAAKLGPVLTMRKLDFDFPKIEPAQAVKQGLEFFNEERYWESHEALESAWRRSEGEEKEILQGIILLAAALVHLQKDESEICLSVMSRAIAKLAAHTGNKFGVSIDAIEKRVQNMISTRKPEFFKIEPFSK
jgi:predicted metal-dependent hydrolase